MKLRNYWDTTRNNERKSKYPNSSISISLTNPSLKKHHAWIVHEFALFKRSNMFLPSKNITTKNTIPIFWLIFIDFYSHLSTYERFLIHRTVVEGFLRFLPTGHLKKMVGVGEPVG